MRRIEQFLRIIESHKLDGFLVTNNMEIRYLCGFSGSAGMLWISPKRCVFLTDFRYETQAKREIGDCAEVHIISAKKDYFALLEELGAMKGVAYAGFDAEKVTFDLHGALSRKFSNVNWIPIRQPAGEMHAKKEGGEIAKIRKAAKIAGDALAETLPMLKPGIAEKEFAGELEYCMRKRGSEKCPFDTIVASGWRAALPHGTASDKIIARGEMVVVDFGAIYDGYASDITRTFFIGKPSPKFTRIYNTVLKAQKSAIRKARPRMKGKDIDKIARKIIAKAGFGKKFGHGLGHGLGLVVHDAPGVSPKSEKVIPENAVVTIEPGIYIEKWGGVRIEDDVVIKKSGNEVLTAAVPKELEDIIIHIE